MLTQDVPSQTVPTPPVEHPEAPLRLVPALCTLCGIEDVEPIAVGEDFEYRTCPDEFLMVRCRQCGLVYLSPRPASEEAGRIYPDHYHAFQFEAESFGLAYKVRCWLETRRLLRWCKGLKSDARILDIGCGDGFHLQLLDRAGLPDWRLEGVDLDERAVAVARSKGLSVHQGRVESLSLEPGYDLILLIMTIEHSEDPVGMLREVSRLLPPGGRVVIVTDNVASSDFGLFGGRHWGGYHFPRHTYLFSRKTLAKLAESADLIPERIRTAVSPVNWVYSIRNRLVDRGAPQWLVNRFSLKSTVSLGVFTLLDNLFSLLGRGAILHATFRKPDSSEEVRA